MSSRTEADQLLRGVKLTSDDAQHVHAGMRLLAQERLDIVPIDLEAHGLLDRRGIGLMRRPIEHRGKSTEVTRCRTIDDDILMVFIDHGHQHLSRDDHIRGAARIPELVNALARREDFQLDLRRKDAQLVLVEQRKERYLPENLWIARHRSPPCEGSVKENFSWTLVEFRSGRSTCV
jgi:hypothetical protein